MRITTFSSLRIFLVDSSLRSASMDDMIEEKWWS